MGASFQIFTKADKFMSKLQRKAKLQQFSQIPEFPTSLPKGGLESRAPMEQLNALATVLDHQANIVDEWREKTVQFLILPLVDEDDEMEITGEEYGQFSFYIISLPFPTCLCKGPRIVGRPMNTIFVLQFNTREKLNNYLLFEGMIKTAFMKNNQTT